jgi:hypothetical protein
MGRYARLRISTVRSSVNRESRACASTAWRIAGASVAGVSLPRAAMNRSSPLSSNGSPAGFSASVMPSL